MREHVDRPEDGTFKALRWDYEMGEHYKGLLEHPAWKNLVAQLHVLREAHIGTLVSGEGDLAEARASVRVVEKLLTTPEVMIMLGAESEKDLRHAAAERNGNERRLYDE